MDPSAAPVKQTKTKKNAADAPVKQAKTKKNVLAAPEAAEEAINFEDNIDLVLINSMDANRTLADVIVLLEKKLKTKLNAAQKKLVLERGIAYGYAW